MKGAVAIPVLGVLLLAGAGAWGIAAPVPFFRGYLTGWLLCLSVALGSMGLVMMHHLTGGRWGWAVRRHAEAAMVTLPAVAVAGLPLAFAGGRLFPWADAQLVAGEPLLQHRAAVFAPPFVLGRAIAYFAIWSAFAWRLRRLSLEHDRTGDASRLDSARQLSAAGLVVYFATMSLATVDWIASREVDWYSSTIGLVTVVGQSATALSFLLVALARSPEGARLAGPRALHDLGNLLQTVVVLWAYIAFAQYLVIWVGNTQEDLLWFHHRNFGGWWLVTAALVVLHFGFPFVLLLFQRAKRSLRALGMIAAVLVVLRGAEMLWTIVPSSLGREPPRPHALDILVPLSLALLWRAAWGMAVSRHPVVPRGAPADEKEAEHGAVTGTIAPGR